MFYKQLLHSSTVRLSLIAVVLCSITLLGARSTGQAKAAAVQAAPSAATEQIFVQCSVLETGMDYRVNVVFIHSTDCVPSTGAIQYFVVVGTDTKKANQVLSIGLTAKAAGRSVLMTYDSSDADVVSPETT